jgi:hypothetical protein
MKRIYRLIPQLLLLTVGTVALQACFYSNPPPPLLCAYSQPRNPGRL